MSERPVEPCVMEPRNGDRAARRLRILCAEDNVMLADVLQRVLERAGHAPELVRDGLEAWERLSRAPEYFDVLFTDHQMPRMNGLALVQRVRTSAFAGKIIVHTSSLTATEVRAYRELAVDLIIPKTTSAADLVQNIETVCRRN